MFAKDLGHSEGMNGRKALGKAFGEFVDRRRLTQTDVAAMGGPSTTSQTKIRMTDESISPQTLRKIDTVMEWGSGTSARIVAGDLPTAKGGLETYTTIELLDVVRDRLLREGETDGTTPKANQKMRSGDDVRDATPDVLVVNEHVGSRGKGSAGDSTQGLVVEVGVDQHEAVPE